MILSDTDLRLICEGAHDRVYEKLGSHVVDATGSSGTHFAVWAPHRAGDLGNWRFQRLERLGTSLVAAGPSRCLGDLCAGRGTGTTYKYPIVSPDGRSRFDSADPYGFAAEVPPGTASKVWDPLRYDWGDEEWMSCARAARRSPRRSRSTRSTSVAGCEFRRRATAALSYREIAPKLADYASEMGFTHVELLPVAEHPALESWGYQVAGFYAATGRYGTPQDLMFLVDTLHRKGLGVILDWVPGHFATDTHGLVEFDGTPLYEPGDPRRRKLPVWNTYAFNYENTVVVNFLTANALFWLDKYHFDGLRVDGVESMIRLDFRRKAGEWEPNRFGGNENLAAIEFLKRVNRKVHERFPGTITIAEDASAPPNLTRAPQTGGLGFDYKWDMGWVHDTVGQYMPLPPERRSEAHSKLLFRMHYAFNENYLLPLSHDDTSNGNMALLARMPGDDWEKRANLRLLYGYMFALPGKKLMFMGDEFGQWAEWSYQRSLDWHLLHDPRHRGLQRWVRDLNTQYRAEPALHELDCRPDGFAWIEADSVNERVLTFLRKAPARRM